MICSKCGYNDNGTGDTAHVCMPIAQDFRDAVLVMPGDYVKTPIGPVLVEDVRLDFDSQSVFLANGQVMAVSELTYDDVLLESEVV